jgi:(p)ppGpp synthase/HD superfamily hydrolase
VEDRVKQAIAFARIAHGDQVRKYTGEEYYNHPIEVAETVATVTDDTNMYIAAILHDTVEDTVATTEDIELFFGSDVATLVSELTDVSRPSDGNRAARKAKDRDHLAKASPRAQTIKYADLLSNTASISEHDPSFAVVYLREKKELLDVMLDGDPILRQRCLDFIKENR